MSGHESSDSVTGLIKPTLPFFGLLFVILIVLPTCTLLASGLPSFGAGIRVTNSENGAVSVRVQSALTDETVLIMPGETGHFKLFAGDHGSEFDQLTQNTVLITATYEGQVKAEYEFHGEELYVKKRAAFTLRGLKFHREDRDEEIVQ